MARMEKLLVRLDGETKLLLQQLADRQATSLSDAVRFAIRDVAWRRGLYANPDGELPDPFTERARKALQASSDEATRHHHYSIRPGHLLLGLISVLDGRAALTLVRLGVDLDRAYATAESVVGKLDASAPADPRNLGLTDDSKRLIEGAVAEANRLGHHYVGTEHLLLGLLIDPDSRATSAVESLGVSRAAVRAAIELQKEPLARRFP